MRELIFEAGWDALLFAMMFLVWCLIGLGRLNRLISALKAEAKTPGSGFESSWLLTESGRRFFSAYTSEDAAAVTGN
ncbi:MAG TPA: hypothetical protein VFB43_22480 [Terracidiphilus sp.]|nr:hypothetical protein [Terracidiphilus sp.]